MKSKIDTLNNEQSEEKISKEDQTSAILTADLYGLFINWFGVLCLARMSSCDPLGRTLDQCPCEKRASGQVDMVLNQVTGLAWMQNNL